MCICRHLYLLLLPILLQIIQNELIVLRLKVIFLNSEEQSDWRRLIVNARQGLASWFALPVNNFAGVTDSENRWNLGMSSFPAAYDIVQIFSPQWSTESVSTWTDAQDEQLSKLGGWSTWVSLIQPSCKQPNIITLSSRILPMSIVQLSYPIKY